LLFFEFFFKISPNFVVKAAPKIEIGVIKKPSVFAVAKIADALEISLDELIK